MCRLLVDPPAAGAWNMAVDEGLLESAALRGQMSLRFYRWSEATLSLGYFQRYEDRRLHAASVPCPCVRRSTGGGAIVHDREVTYSLAVPAAHPWARSALSLYQAVHGALVETLCSLGFAASLATEAAKRSEAPLLCFRRLSVGDVLVAGHKVAGSAQRRWRGAVLQHGSILLASSPAAPELPGLNDLSNKGLVVEDLIAGVVNRLAKNLSCAISASELSGEEQLRARDLVATKYGHSSWTLRR
jgi:lipoate-protein ligase A